MTGIYYDISHEDYLKVDRVSNSYLSRIGICPAAAKVPQDDTPQMQTGRLFHAFALQGKQEWIVEPSIDKRTKAGKDEYKQWEEQVGNSTRITKDDEEKLLAMKSALFTHPFAYKLISGGAAEATVFWTDPFSGIECKARPDKLPNDNTLIDLKTTSDASANGFQRSILKFGYHRQAAFYLDGTSAATNSIYDLFAFIAVETKPPYRVEVYTISKDFIAFGRHEYRYLINIENNCRLNNKWPNYTNETVTELDLPKWAGGSF